MPVDKLLFKIRSLDVKSRNLHVKRSFKYTDTRYLEKACVLFFCMFSYFSMFSLLWCIKSCCNKILLQKEPLGLIELSFPSRKSYLYLLEFFNE